MDTLKGNYGSSSEDEAEDDSKDQPEAKKSKVSVEENLHLKPPSLNEFSSVKTVRVAILSTSYNELYRDSNSFPFLFPQLAVVSAPHVQPNETMDTRRAAVTRP